MVKFILINLICIIMDIVLICLEYANKYLGEASMKPMIYVIKLKLEFTVLNQADEYDQGWTHEGNRRMGDPSPELQNQAFGNNSPPLAKFGIWGTTKPAEDAPVEPSPDQIIQSQREIYTTQQIQVLAEGGNLSLHGSGKRQWEVSISLGTIIRGFPWFFLSRVRN